MKLSNTAIKELSAKYRSILKKCVFLNALLIMGIASQAMASWDAYLGIEGTPSDLLAPATPLPSTVPTGLDITITSTTKDVNGNDLNTNNPIYGGYAASSATTDVTNNTITMMNTNGTFYAVVAGLNEGTGDTSNNTLNISNGTITQLVGGISTSGNSEKNTINISGGSIDTVYGGSSSSSNGQANNNTVTITGGNPKVITGGMGYTANENKVEITFETSSVINGSSIIGGKADSGSSGGDATYNEVSITNAVSSYDNFFIYGGYATGGNADYNKVNLTGVTGTEVYGGYGSDASGNTISINNGTFTNIYGGYFSSENASNNKIIINDLTIKGDYGSIYGGYQLLPFPTNTKAEQNLVYLNGNITTTSSNTATLMVSMAKAYQATSNTLVIGRNARFENINLSLQGFLYTPLYHSSGSNNTLEVWTKGISADTIENFDHLYFVLPDSIQNGDTILSLNQSTNISNINVGVATQSGVNLNVGDSVTLIDNTVDDFDPSTQTIDMQNLTTGTIKGGSFLTDYTFGLSTEGSNNALIATVTGKTTNDEIKAPAEGQVASMVLLNTAGDLIASVALDNAVGATKESHGNLATFSAISGGYSKHKTGSHINLASASLLTGFAKNFVDKATAGIFVEAGYGDYSTHNNFSKGKVKGDGDSKYYGLGFMGRYDLTKNLYAEASVHGGYLNNDWKSNDTKTPVDYDTDSLYYGAHLGLGYEAALNKTFGWGVYGQYFYTHQEGDDATIDGTKFDFKDVDSHITRLGTRLYYTASDNFKPFMGVAWDHEYDGKAKSYAGDGVVDAPSLKGDTGMLEFGLKANNLEQSAWDIDASLQGFIGQREGVQGLVKAKYNF